VRSGPEALGSASGYAVPSRRRLLWPHLSFWSAPGGLWSSPTGLCLAAAGQKVPVFSLRILPFVPPSVPRQTGRSRTIVRPPVIAFARMRGGSASATSHLNRYLWVPLRGCEVRLMLRPEQLLALHRQGRLRSSFHSHESPHQNVEHDYAGKSSISRGRTYTGWIRSLTGCTAFGAGAAHIPGQIVATG